MTHFLSIFTPYYSTSVKLLNISSPKANILNFSKTPSIFPLLFVTLKMGVEGKAHKIPNFLLLILTIP